MSASFTAVDHVFMQRALALGARGAWTATPNPNVGCVIVKHARVIGEGFHAKAGEAHAERIALAACDESPQGSTVYLTLEPCAHHGRTPPCVDALIEARVARVVAALEDPNPKVKGEGFARLRAAGIACDVGLMRGQAAELHKGFLMRMVRGRPWMRVKMAASMDGRSALANGASQWITSEAARRDAHALRARSCAVLTGIGTVKSDDPQLTVRHVETARQPVRIVLDRRLEISPGARVLQGGGTLILSARDDADKRHALEAAGATVVRLPDHDGRFDFTQVMHELAQREFNEVTVEAGANLAGALLDAGLVDELVLYQAPAILGDAARGLFATRALQRLEDKIELDILDTRMLGPDLRITALIKPRV